MLVVFILIIYRWTIAPAAIPAVKVVDVDQFSVSIKDVDSASMAIPETQLTPQGPNYDKRTSTVLYASCKENTRGKANIHKQWNFEGVKVAIFISQKAHDL